MPEATLAEVAAILRQALADCREPEPEGFWISDGIRSWNHGEDSESAVHRILEHLPAALDALAAAEARLADAWDEGWRAANASSYTAPLAGDNPYRAAP